MNQRFTFKIVTDNRPAYLVNQEVHAAVIDTVSNIGEIVLDSDDARIGIENY